MSSPLAIGIDLGATKIAASLVTRAGEVLAVEQIGTLANEGFEWVVDRVSRLIDALGESAPGPIDGIGIGTPGQVDLHTGTVKDAVNLGWQTVPLIATIRARLKQDRP